MWQDKPELRTHITLNLIKSFRVQSHWFLWSYRRGLICSFFSVEEKKNTLKIRRKKREYLQKLNDKKVQLENDKLCVCSCATDSVESCSNIEWWHLSWWANEEEDRNSTTAMNEGRWEYVCVCVCSLAVIHCIWANLCKVKRNLFGSVPPLMRLWAVQCASERPVCH